MSGMSKPRGKSQALRKTSIYLRPKTSKVLKAASAHFGCTQVDFLEQAVWHLADALGVEAASEDPPAPRQSVSLHEAVQAIRS